MRRTPLPLAFLAAVSLVACTGSPPGTPRPTPTPPPTASPGATVGPLPTPADHELSLAEQKYRLIDAFGPLTYCDPDEYPIAHGDEGQKAAAQFPAIQADVPTFSAILDRLGIVGQDSFGADQKLAIYREWKRLNAVVLTDVGGGRAEFDLVTETDLGMGQGVESKGTIDSRGAVVVVSSQPAFLAGCPICLARGTPIDTPRGPIGVESLRVGDPVWTLGADGRRVAGVVVRIGHAAVPPTHQVVQLVLRDGRSVVVSPGHPLPDGRRAGDLREGDPVDGSIVTSATRSTYGLPFTFDLLPSGDTGLYWASGILLASTLQH